MATYGYDEYGLSTYGPSAPTGNYPGSSVAIPVVNTAYIFPNMAASVQNYSDILVTWGSLSTATMATVTEFRLLTSPWGFPVDQNDGTIVLDVTGSPPAPGIQYLDTSATPGQVQYYGIYVLVNGTWLRGGFTACLLPYYHGYDVKLLSDLPVYFQNQDLGVATADVPVAAPNLPASGGSLVNPYAFDVDVWLSNTANVLVNGIPLGQQTFFTLPASCTVTISYGAGTTWSWISRAQQPQNNALEQYLAVLGMGLDIVKSQYDMKLKSLNNPMKMSLGDLADFCAEIGLPYNSEIPAYVMRKAALLWGTVMQERGTLDGIAEHITLLTGYQADVQVSRNFMLDDDQSAPADPIWPAWQANTKYNVGERVTFPVAQPWSVVSTYNSGSVVIYNDVLYTCTVNGTTMIPPTNISNWTQTTNGPYVYYCILANQNQQPSGSLSANTYWTALYGGNQNGTEYSAANVIPDIGSSAGTWEFMGLSGAGGGSGGSGNITVNFTSNVATVDALGVGITITGYDGSGHNANITKSAAWKNSLAALAPAHCRIPIRYNSGNPGIGAGGALTSGDAATYIGAIKSIGATPYVIYVDDSGGNTLTNANATNLVNYFNAGGGANNGPVPYWIVGNEPEGTGGNAAYEALVGGIVSAMHTADATVKVAAPAAAYWDTGLLSNASVTGSGMDIMDYHAYDGANTDGSGFPTDGQYYTHVHTDLPGYAPGKRYAVTECNWHFEYNDPGSSGNTTTSFYDWHNTNFIADVAGQVLSAGGHFTMFGDSNGALGLMNDGSGNNAQPGTFGTTFPAYWGLAIWTGGGTGMASGMKRWGTHMVSASTTFTGRLVTVYACDNGKIVICNNDPSNSHALTIAVTQAGGATTGTYNVWATSHASPLSPVTQVVSNAAFSGGVINYTIPAGTVVSVDVTAGGGGGGSVGNYTAEIGVGFPTPQTWTQSGTTPTTGPNGNGNTFRAYNNTTGTITSPLLRSVARSTADVAAGKSVPDPILVVEHGVPVPSAIQPWNASTTYPTGSVVTYGNINYIALRQSKGANPPGQQIVLNANYDFETGITPWTVEKNCTISQSAAFAYHGTKSLQMVASTTDAAYISENISIIPGATYVASALVYASTGTPGVELAVNYNDPFGNYIGGSYPGFVTLANATWTALSTVFTLPIGAGQAVLSPSMNTVATAYWDLVELTCIATPEWAPLGGDARIPVTMSGYGVADLGFTPTTSATVTPFCEWYDNWGNLITRVFARSSSSSGGYPANYQYDGFDTGPGYPLSGRVPAIPTAVWSVPAGSWNVSTNGVAFAGPADADALGVLPSPAAGTVAATVISAAQSGDDCGPLFWYNNTSNFWVAGLLQLYYVAAATTRTVAYTGTAPSVGDRIYVEFNNSTSTSTIPTGTVTGPSVFVYKNSRTSANTLVVVGSGGTATQTAMSSLTTPYLPSTGATTSNAGIASIAV